MHVSAGRCFEWRKPLRRRPNVGWRADVAASRLQPIHPRRPPRAFLSGVACKPGIRTDVTRTGRSKGATEVPAFSRRFIDNATVTLRPVLTYIKYVTAEFGSVSCELNSAASKLRFAEVRSVYFQRDPEDTCWRSSGRQHKLQFPIA